MHHDNLIHTYGGFRLCNNFCQQQCFDLPIVFSVHFTVYGGLYGGDILGVIIMFECDDIGSENVIYKTLL